MKESYDSLTELLNDAAREAREAREHLMEMGEAGGGCRGSVLAGGVSREYWESHVAQVAANLRAHWRKFGNAEEIENLIEELRSWEEFPESLDYGPVG